MLTVEGGRSPLEHNTDQRWLQPAVGAQRGAASQRKRPQGYTVPEKRGASGIDREEVVFHAEGLAGAEAWRTEYRMWGRVQ